MDEQAEGVTSRVEVDTNVVLWLKAGRCRSDCDRMRSSLIQVVNANVQVQHLLLLAGLFRPYRGSIVCLGLKRQACSAFRAPEQDPVWLTPFHFPPQELSIEVREGMSIRTVQDHRCKRESGGSSHSITVSSATRFSGPSAPVLSSGFSIHAAEGIMAGYCIVDSHLPRCSQTTDPIHQSAFDHGDLSHSRSLLQSPRCEPKRGRRL